MPVKHGTILTHAAYAGCSIAQVFGDTQQTILPIVASFASGVYDNYNNVGKYATHIPHYVKLFA